MLDEIASNTVHKQEARDWERKQRKTMNEVKLFKKIDKDPLSFQGENHMQKETPPCI